MSATAIAAIAVHGVHNQRRGHDGTRLNAGRWTSQTHGAEGGVDGEERAGESAEVASRPRKHWGSKQQGGDQACIITMSQTPMSTRPHRPAADSAAVMRPAPGH